MRHAYKKYKTRLIILKRILECICPWKFIKNKKMQKMKHAYNKDKTHLIISQKVTFHELK